MKRRFEGIWIPAEIWLHFDVEFHLRMLVSEIKSLDAGPDGCIASNGYFAKQFGRAESTISGWISECEDRGWIERDIEYYPGSKEVKVRRLFYKEFQGVKKGMKMPFAGIRRKEIDWEEVINTPFDGSNTPFDMPNTPLRYAEGYSKVSIKELLYILGKRIEKLENELYVREMRESGMIPGLEDGEIEVEEARQFSFMDDYEVKEKEWYEKLMKRLGSRRKNDVKYGRKICEVIDIFNEEAEGIREHRYYTKGVWDRVLYWLKKGYDVEDFRKVIKYKVRDLAHSPKYIQLPTFLRDSKFEVSLEAAEQELEVTNGNGKMFGNDYMRFCMWIGQNERLRDQLPTYLEFEAMLKREGKWSWSDLRLMNRTPSEVKAVVKEAIDELTVAGGLQGDKKVLDEVFYYLKNKK